MIDRERVVQAIQLIATQSVKAVLAEFRIDRLAFYRAIFTDPDLTRLYEAAQAAKAELYVDEIIEIADTEPDPQAARNRIDARRWYASKMRPSRYGDQLKIQVEHSVDLSGALREARQRIPQVIPPAIVQPAIDTTANTLETAIDTPALNAATLDNIDPIFR